MALPLSTPGKCCGHNLNMHSGNGLEGTCIVCSCVGFEPDTEDGMEKDRKRQCSARHGQKVYLRCQDQVTEMTVHNGLHWAVDRDGQTVRWDNLAATYGPEVANPDRTRFETKDSGVRAEYDSGMVRDTQEGKARFELLLPLGVPYRDQFLVRVAELMARGAEKYSDRNWEKANGTEELERFKSSALRHLLQWAAGETDEDHAAAVVFNLLGYETTKRKIDGSA